METQIAEEEVKGKKLYIAGVSWNTTDDGFLNYFARFGDISEALVMRDRTGKSRGFGFVTFKDPSIAEKLQNQHLMLDGRKLDVMDAIPRAEMITAVKTQAPKKLYVAGVSWNTTDDGLFNFFSRFGTVVSAQIQRDRAGGKSRGFGFVTFEDPSSAEKVLAEQALSLDGRRLEIKAAVPRGLVGTIEAERLARPKKIFVAGLSDSVTEGELRDHFAQYGRVVEATIQKDRQSGESRGFGFVTFDSGDPVEKVLVKGSQKLGDKCVVDVKIARPKETPILPAGGPPGASVWSSTFGPGPTWAQQGVNSSPHTAWGAPPPQYHHPPSGWGAPEGYQQQHHQQQPQHTPGLGLARGGLQGPPTAPPQHPGPPGFDGLGGQFQQYGAFQRGRPTGIPRRTTFHPYSR
jgi:RNA recognition motif-containing protein